MQIGQILNANRTSEGIMIRRLTSLPDADGLMSMTVAEVLPGDPEWLEALAALPEGDPPEDPAAPPIEYVRTQAINGVNRAAGEVRRKWITQIPGQEMLYLEKRSEAEMYLSDPDPVPAAYPLIMAEVGITAPDAWAVAQTYVNMAAMFRAIAAPLETARLMAIETISVAPDAETVAAVVAQTLSAFTAVAEGASR